MPTWLDSVHLSVLAERLKQGNAEHSTSYPGFAVRRQPVHTVYGGAHLFTAETPAKLALIARRSLASAGGAAAFYRMLGMPRQQASAAEASRLYQRVEAKLAPGAAAVEDFRIDFEDGFGVRGDEAEDAAAVSSAAALAQGLAAGSLPPFIGLRIKALGAATHQRAGRTLELFLATLLKASGGALPPVFLVTLPKVVGAFQVAALAELCAALEDQHGLVARSLKLEVMVETTELILGAEGRSLLPELYPASDGRLVAAHFGAYDYTAACQVAAPDQRLDHPACDFARQMMLAAFAGQPVWLADGATTLLPLAGQEAAAWQLAYANIRRGLSQGFYQGWDLHPAQLPARYAATYSFFDDGLAASSQRLSAFFDQQAQATRSGAVFDDAATGRGLMNFFSRALSCGALEPGAVPPAYHALVKASGQGLGSVLG